MVDDGRVTRLGRPPRFTLDQVLDAAEGLPYDRLTMTALAEELGVVTSALYRYVKDRDDLVAKLTARLSGLLTIPDEDLPWDEWLAEMALGFYDLIIAHPVLSDTQSLWTLMAGQGMGLIHAAERVLGAAGFTLEDAARLHNTSAMLGVAMASSEVRLAELAAGLAPAADFTPAWGSMPVRSLLADGISLLADGARLRLPKAERRAKGRGRTA